MATGTLDLGPIGIILGGLAVVADWPTQTEVEPARRSRPPGHVGRTEVVPGWVSLERRHSIVVTPASAHGDVTGPVGSSLERRRDNLTTTVWDLDRASVVQGPRWVD